MPANPLNAFSRPRPKQGHLLVVEDNPDNWELIQAASQQTMPAVEIVWANTAERALTHLNDCIVRHEPLPKLMLLDLYLPDAEQSWQLLHTLKQPQSPYVWMPVVLISHSDQRRDINDFYQFGGTSYIIKPTTYEQWVSYFETVRLYWWETVTLPK